MILDFHRENGDFFKITQKSYYIGTTLVIKKHTNFVSR